MKEIARIVPPPRHADGEFDHAAVNTIGDRLYVVYPSNDAVEVVDLATRRRADSTRGLSGVAGVGVDAETRLPFRSSRDEDTASRFRRKEGAATKLFRVRTGARPNGIAFDPGRGIPMVVGNPTAYDVAPTLTWVDVRDGSVRGMVRAWGRTRWAPGHPVTDTFDRNLAELPPVVATRAGTIPAVAATFAMAVQGPLGLEPDTAGLQICCACEEEVLVSLDHEMKVYRVLVPLCGISGRALARPNAIPPLRLDGKARRSRCVRSRSRARERENPDGQRCPHADRRRVPARDARPSGHVAQGPRLRRPGRPGPSSCDAVR